jgi:hypothetical protein
MCGKTQGNGMVSGDERIPRDHDLADSCFLVLLLLASDVCYVVLLYEDYLHGMVKKFLMPCADSLLY